MIKHFFGIVLGLEKISTLFKLKYKLNKMSELDLPVNVQKNSSTRIVNCYMLLIDEHFSSRSLHLL